MISFFGMTLDEHLRAAQTYGNLGIVFKDEIMNLCELNPVRYVSKHSIIAKRISQFEEYKSSIEFSGGEIIVHGKGGISDVQFNSFLRGEGAGFKYHAVRTWLENLAYSKSFIAELERRDKESQKYYISNKNYIFGMEREWRLVPTELFVNFDKTKNRLEDDDFFLIYKNIDLIRYIDMLIINPESENLINNILVKYGLQNVKLVMNESYGNL